MTGAIIGALIPRILVALVLAALGLAAHKRDGRESGLLIFLVVIGLELVLLVHTRSVLREIRGHYYITTLDPNQILSISISGETFEANSAIAAITGALRSSSPFTPSHTRVEDWGYLEIRPKNGQSVKYSLGRIHQGRDFLIHDSGFNFQDINRELVGVTEKLQR